MLLPRLCFQSLVLIWAVKSAVSLESRQILSNSTARTSRGAVGGDVTCAILEYEQVKCFGRGAFGQLGPDASRSNLGDSSSSVGLGLPLLSLATQAPIKTLAIGSQHACALSVESELQCWGENRSGELGFSNSSSGLVELPSKLVPIKDVAAGDGFTCLLSTFGSILCFGNNTEGQLGQGSTLPNADSRNFSRLVRLRKKAKMICCGFHHACALLEDNSVQCWGSGIHGQLGTGSPENIGDKSGDMDNNNISMVDLGVRSRVESIACGGDHTCVLIAEKPGGGYRGIKCFGRNDKGQLGYDTNRDIGTVRSDMGENLPFVNLGSNRSASMITTGTDFTCALLDDRSLKCWGSNSHNQLLQDSTESIGDEPGEMASLKPINLGQNTSRVAAIYASKGGMFRHVCALLSPNRLIPGDLICWGSGLFGQRGIGTNESSPLAEANATVLPIANLGPRPLPTALLFTEFSPSLPCSSREAADYSTCRVVNMSSNPFLTNERFLIFPEGPGLPQVAIVIVVQGQRPFAGRSDGIIIEVRVEGDRKFSSHSAYSDTSDSTRWFQLKVPHGTWVLENCPMSQPFQGDRTQCYYWGFVRKVPMRID